MKKRRVKRNNLILTIVIILAVLIIGFLIYYNFLKPNISLGPVSSITGLPSGFAPTVAYYHGLAGGRISLWDTMGKAYVSSDGKTFNEYTSAMKQTDGFPVGFTPTLGFAQNLTGKWAMGLWSKNQGYYYYDEVSKKFVSSTLCKSYSPLPCTFLPSTLYFNRFGAGLISFWGLNGQVYNWNSQTKAVVALTPTNLASAGLPTGVSPKIGYYYESSTEKSIHLWYLINGQVKLYKFSATTGKFSLVTLPTGLLTTATTQTPTTGYWDQINKGVVLWYGTNAYFSSDGKIFSKVTITYPQVCDSSCKSVILKYFNKPETDTQVQKILSSNFKTTTTCTNTIVGDVNNDKVVNAVDVQLVINIALGVASVSTYPCGDINKDGFVNAVDVQLVINGALGLIAPNNENLKDITKYSTKESFLISDSDWRAVLTLVPLTTWTGKETTCQRGYGTSKNVCVYPTLIYHDETSQGAGFDADSIIYFMQQYTPSKLTIVGTTPLELDQLLTTEPELGAKIQNAQLQKITIQNYLRYWKAYKDIVYVQNDYELSLMASTYASLINAPLIIKGYNDNIDLTGRNVICIGNVGSTLCKENYNLEALQKKYIAKTQELDGVQTDKIILVNPNDLTIKVNSSAQFQPDRSLSVINEIYSKTSLASPILASAKHEVIISTTATDYQTIDSFIEGKIGGLYASKYDVKYLTILASPNTIEMSRDSNYDYINRKWKEEIDNYFYGNLDEDFFQELAVGRIFSLTSSDISAYLSRDLFYSYTPKNNDFSVIWPPAPSNYPFHKISAVAIENIFKSMGLNSISFITDENNIPNPKDFKNKFMLTYLDHSGTYGGVYNFNSYSLKNEKVWLNSPLVFMEGCESCAFELAGGGGVSSLFCANLIRRGAIFHYGATVDDSGENWDPAKMVVEELFVSENIGSAVKEIKNKAVSWIIDRENVGGGYGSYPWGYHDPWNVLMGDPTFNPNLKTPILEKLTVSFEKNNENSYISINVPKQIKNVNVKYDDFGDYDSTDGVYMPESVSQEINYFNYPYGNNIGRFIQGYQNVYKSTDGSLVFSWASDEGVLLFAFEAPTNYVIKNIQKVEYSDLSGVIELKHMPVFESGWCYASDDLCTPNFNYITYIKDEETNKYYFVMHIIYGGNPPIVQTQDTIPEHKFKIYLELEEE